jgi:hypothetical protein
VTRVADADLLALLSSAAWINYSLPLLKMEDNSSSSSVISHNKSLEHHHLHSLVTLLEVLRPFVCASATLAMGGGEEQRKEFYHTLNRTVAVATGKVGAGLSSSMSPAALAHMLKVKDWEPLAGQGEMCQMLVASPGWFEENNYPAGCEMLHLIEFPGAEYITITFDARSATEEDEDKVVFWKPESDFTSSWGKAQYSGSYGWPGTSGEPPLVIPADRVLLKFQADDSVGDRGFLLQASAPVSERSANLLFEEHGGGAVSKVACRKALAAAQNNLQRARSYLTANLEQLLKEAAEVERKHTTGVAGIYRDLGGSYEISLQTAELRQTTSETMTVPNELWANEGFNQLFELPGSALLLLSKQAQYEQCTVYGLTMNDHEYVVQTWKPLVGETSEQSFIKRDRMLLVNEMRRKQQQQQQQQQATSASGVVAASDFNMESSSSSNSSELTSLTAGESSERFVKTLLLSGGGAGGSGSGVDYGNLQDSDEESEPAMEHEVSLDPHRAKEVAKALALHFPTILDLTTVEVTDFEGLSTVHPPLPTPLRRLLARRVSQAAAEEIERLKTLTKKGAKVKKIRDLHRWEFAGFDELSGEGWVHQEQLKPKQAPPPNGTNAPKFRLRFPGPNGHAYRYIGKRKNFEHYVNLIEEEQEEIKDAAGGSAVAATTKVSAQSGGGTSQQQQHRRHPVAWVKDNAWVRREILGLVDEAMRETGDGGSLPEIKPVLFFKEVSPSPASTPPSCAIPREACALMYIAARSEEAPDHPGQFFVFDVTPSQDLFSRKVECFALVESGRTLQRKLVFTSDQRRSNGFASSFKFARSIADGKIEGERSVGWLPGMRYHRGMVCRSRGHLGFF